jgi:pyocin large subunit-like protein
MQQIGGKTVWGRAFSRKTGFGLAGLLMTVCLAFGCGSPQSPQADAPKTGPAVESPRAAPPVARPDIGFASRQKTIDHYRKHGREFGSITIEQYVRKAQGLRDRPAGGSVLESVRSDGVVTRFDRGSGDFIAFNRDGTIRTYFRPADGEAYYQRQLRRKH